MSDFDRTDTQCQPCDKFTPDTGYYGMERHCCPRCRSDTAQRVFCLNCNRDHHSGGWNACDAIVKQRGENIGQCAYGHPACAALRQEPSHD